MENRIRYNQAMKILLATLHAKYVHSSLALPYLAAVCRDIDGIETVIREFTVNEQSGQVLRKIVAEGADIAAFSCYIWNVEQTLKLVSDLKKILPEARIILGGPEVSYNPDEILRKNEAVDCIIRGEGEEVFHRLVAGWKQYGSFAGAIESIPEGTAFRKGADFIINPPAGPVRDMDSIPSPFNAGLVDMGKPLVYYETSRGCPFSCAFCMSSLGNGVNSFSMERIEQDLLYLMEHRAATVKLVDRTFNYDADRANRIWKLILRHNRDSRFHFEIAADLLTEENLELLGKVPDGLFRFEIGIQSGSAGTLAEVGRKTNLDRLFANVEQLVARTGVIIHLDLIAGLPGEDYKGFLASLQRLFDVNPHHIQVEPLKVLKGSPMEDIAARDGYAFSDHPPYRILTTSHLSFSEITRIEIIARLLDIYFNSGRFPTLMKALAERGELSLFFHSFALYAEKSETDAILSLRGNFELIWNFIKVHFSRQDGESLTDVLCYDFCRCEYPAAGSLPIFFPPAGGSGSTISTGEIVKSLDIDRRSKVRTFSRRFLSDYTCSPWRKEATEVIFIYVSAPGKGLQVKTISVVEGVAG